MSAYITDSTLRKLLLRQTSFVNRVQSNDVTKGTEADRYLRDWQKQALQDYLRREFKEIEVTSAYQGSGKTVYSAAFYIAAQLKNSAILNKRFSEIKRIYRHSEEIRKNFCVVFIPAHSIKYTTINAWKSLGVNLIYKNNPQLKKTSLECLMSKGINGLICTYQQASHPDYKEDGIWIKSPLINFLKNSDDIKIHAVLDECHEASLGTLKSKFFVDNQSVFYHLHLMSGTLVNTSVTKLQSGETTKIPFVNYDPDGNAIPDTIYSQEDAINDGNIVRTEVISHPIARASVKINNKEYELTTSDLDWFFANFSRYAFKYKEHEKHDRLHEIDKAFKEIYSSEDIWRNLLIYGTDWLSKIKQKYPRAKGIIFAPSRKATIMIHRNLLPHNSVLCVSRRTDKAGLTGCKYTTSDQISEWLEVNDNTIDWIVSCETLKQGFDYPKAKVQILIPQLQHLHLVKLSQMLGRTNRGITNYKDLEAVCLTIDHSAVKELLKCSLDSSFGIRQYSEVLESYTEQSHYQAIERVIAAEKGIEQPKNIVKITDLVMSSMIEKITAEGCKLFSYTKDVNKKLDSLHIQTYWHHWGSIVKQNLYYPDPELILPPNEPGIYTVVNVKSLEILYIGCADNLLKRISNKTRYGTLEWLIVENPDNLFINWITVPKKSHSNLEKKLIKELKPKYNVIKYDNFEEG